MHMILLLKINLKKHKQNKKEMINKEDKDSIDKLDLKEHKYLVDRNKELLYQEQF